ncbi:hypothetical protein FVR03_24045 [Pontibacter qinzhouensis]|uniref:Uncharacterized protein n=1 Tax=Pontibacter qinzhouensis TaxID=2603253 RepID=A0A5C8IDZ8_9BACT|nr:hypothetical protein [Pontibacter qinzhouensis]TXK18381.1 hypothetical protein FVR03_24045 [Pontibacter qinzhouensis]
MAYLNSAYGSISSEFNAPGISRVALIEKAKVASAVGGLDITALTLETGALFQEIYFMDDSATYTQELVSSTGAKYVNQTLNFRVESDELSKAHEVILGRHYVALIRKNNGKWTLLGQTNGLKTTAATANTTGDDDANLSFTLSGKNLGFGANVLLSDSDVEALINTVSTPA